MSPTPKVDMAGGYGWLYSKANFNANMLKNISRRHREGIFVTIGNSKVIITHTWLAPADQSLGWRY